MSAPDKILAWPDDVVDYYMAACRVEDMIIPEEVAPHEEYLLSTPARVHADELVALVQDQLDAMVMFGIQGGSVTAARALLAKIKGDE